MTATTLGQAAAVAFHTGGGSVQDRWERAGQAAIDAFAGDIREVAREKHDGTLILQRERDEARARVTELESALTGALGGRDQASASYQQAAAELARLSAAIAALADLWVREADEGDAAKSSLGFDGIATEARQMRRVHAAALRKALGGDS